MAVSGVMDGTLINTVMTQKITFSRHAGTWMNYAGLPSAWHGIRFMTEEDGSISFRAADGEFTGGGSITPEIAGTELLGKEIELKIELFESGKNVNMGLYINGKLYDDRYFVLQGASGKLGGNVGFYISDEQGYVTVGEPEAAPTLDPDFTRLTFNSYDIESGTYGYVNEGMAVSGHCKLDSLDRVIFSDKVNFSENSGVQLRIGGKETPWYGIVLSSVGDGKLYLTGAVEGVTPMIFDSKKAGVPLTDNDVELALSFEYVDFDGDGKKDDVRLGVFFDGKAYNDRWIYLPDYADQLGGYLGIYSPNADSALKIETYMPPIDFAEFGFTKEWAITLGLK